MPLRSAGGATRAASPSRILTSGSGSSNCTTSASATTAVMSATDVSGPTRARPSVTHSTPTRQRYGRRWSRAQAPFTPRHSASRGRSGSQVVTGAAVGVSSSVPTRGRRGDAVASERRRTWLARGGAALLSSQPDIPMAMSDTPRESDPRADSLRASELAAGSGTISSTSDVTEATQQLALSSTATRPRTTHRAPG